LAERFRRWPGLIRRAAHWCASALPPSRGRMGVAFRAKRFVRGAEADPGTAHALWRIISDRAGRAALLSESDADGGEPEAAVAALWAACSGDVVARALQVDLETYLPDDILVKTDTMSMAHGVEIRCPFLDRALVEYMFSLPTAAKVRGWSRKRFLRLAMAERLPDEILRRNKQGFSVPLNPWLRGPLRPLMQTLLSPDRLRKMPFLSSDAVSRIRLDHETGRADRSFELWGLMCLSVWHATFIERDRVDGPIRI
ncbi:MAG: asparagine synthase C-terminal domain-containing protein, partial [bacterium]